MTKRENTLRALRRDDPESIPFEFSVCPSIADKLKESIGTADYQEYFGFPVRLIEPGPTKKKTDYSVYYRNLPDNAEPLNWAPEWGVLGVKGSVAHFQEMLHPMKDFQSIEDIESYPFPDFNEDYRWESFKDKVKDLVNADFIAVAQMQLGDDVATQLGMMINPRLWRSLIKPRLARVVKAAKDVKPDILMFYHGDGNMREIIPDIIEIGIDILNPVQPECMDPFEIKKLYGNDLSFWGTLGTQTTLPFGTRHEVRETCKKLIQAVGKGGGLLLSPTHLVEPDVPIENLFEFIETVRKFGKY